LLYHEIRRTVNLDPKVARITINSTDMQASKYATKTPAQSIAQSRAEKVAQDQERATRLLGRVRWKAELLMVSYHNARRIVLAADAQHDGHSEQDTTSVSSRSISVRVQRETDIIKKQAEAMFKLDFFEFYVLLERYITVCLSIVGVNVSGAAPATNLNALRYVTNPDLHRTRPLASHAFHANLLDALDDEKCPLYASFGIQDIRIQLGLAKDFRNAWKNADERVIASKWHTENGDILKNITLSDSQLELMLRALITGSDHAHGIVQAYTDSQSSGGITCRDFQLSINRQNASVSDLPFEYMDDAMELD
jgi:hypothetical protein